MGKYFDCTLIGSNCNFAARASTVEEILAKVAEHAKTAHGISPMPPEMESRIKSVIRDE